MAAAGNVPWPDPDTIPHVAYLVIGANPYEDRHGRDFYDDPNFYMLDNYGSPDPDARYIYLDFNDFDKLDRLLEYENKFDVIIFDYSVFKCVHGTFPIIDKLLALLQRIVKQDGLIIIDSAKPMTLSPSENRKTQTNRYINNIRRPLKDNQIYIATIQNIIDEVDVAKRVYGPLIEIVYNDISPDSTAIVIPIHIKRGSTMNKYNRNARTRRIVRARNRKSITNYIKTVKNNNLVVRFNPMYRRR